jgi:hypothetical protein
VPDDLMTYVFGGLGLLLAIWVLRNIIVMIRSARRSAEEVELARKKQEALFEASFPELQPHFHPEKVLQFVDARRARKEAMGTSTWKNPPGFAAAAIAEFAADPKGEAVRLLDAAGTLLARFVFQETPEGGVIRMGAGKFTVNLKDAAVRYWHPEREFKWSRLKGWRVLTTLSDRSIDSTDRGTSFSSDGPSTTSMAAGAAAAAVVAGAGGTFDGGGSSSAWDGSSGESRTSY